MSKYICSSLALDVDYSQKDLVKMAESFLESFLHNNITVTMSFFSNDCVWYFPGSLFFKTEYRGINETIKLLENIFKIFPEGLSIIPESFLSHETNVLKIKWKSSAFLKIGEYSNNGVMNITFNERGLIKEIEEYLDTAKLCRLFS